MTSALLDTDRIALSNELMSLADRYVIEAGEWAAEGCRAELMRNARLLAELGRQVLTTADLTTADAYARAGHLVLGNVQGARRFFRAVLTPPTPARGR